MKVKFNPALCDGVNYTGHVILRMPTYAERMGLYTDDILDETLGDPGAEAVTPEEVRAAAKRTQSRGKAMMQHVGSKLGEFIAEVAITRVSDGFVFETFDQLNYDSDMVAVMSECSQRVIGKYQVGAAPQ